MDTEPSQRRQIGPKPYASSDIMTPKRFFELIFSPFSITQFILIWCLFVSVILITTVYITNLDYTPMIILLGFFSSLTAILAGLWEQSKQYDEHAIPALKHASRLENYMKQSTRVAVGTVIGVLLVILTLTILHFGYMQGRFFSMNSITRLSVVLLTGTALFASYIVIFTLFSYAPSSKGGIFTVSLQIISLPKLITLAGLVIPLILLLFTAIYYNEPAVLTIPFNITYIDSIVLLISFVTAYVLSISQITYDR